MFREGNGNLFRNWFWLRTTESFVRKYNPEKINMMYDINMRGIFSTGQLVFIDLSGKLNSIAFKLRKNVSLLTANE